MVEPSETGRVQADRFTVSWRKVDDAIVMGRWIVRQQRLGGDHGLGLGEGSGDQNRQKQVGKSVCGFHVSTMVRDSVGVKEMTAREQVNVDSE